VAIAVGEISILPSWVSSDMGTSYGLHQIGSRGIILPL
jgi:hypothetical protein